MQTLHLDEPGADTVVAEALRDGHLIVMPSDTLSGFSAALTSEPAYRRVLRIKGYAENRQFVYLAASVSMAERFISSWGCTSRRQMASIWPAPLTGIFVAGDPCPRWVGRTIALRVPDASRICRVIDAVGEPVLSTSVNRAGDTPTSDPDEIAATYAGAVDLVVIQDAPAQERPSTLVDFSGTAPQVLRVGAYAWAAATGDEKPSN